MCIRDRVSTQSTGVLILLVMARWWHLFGGCCVLAALIHPTPFQMAHSVLTPGLVSECASQGGGLGLVVVTGVSGGLGLDVATALVAQGWTVLGTVRRVEDGIRVEKKLSAGSFGGKFEWVLCDVSHGNQVATLARRARELLGHHGMGLRGLVNNAGVSGRSTLQDWIDGGAHATTTRMLEVNTVGLVNVTGTMLPLLLEEAQSCAWPRIINIGSLAAYAVEPGSAAYAASKAAVERISDDLRRMLFGKRVWVSVVEPGFVASGMCNRIECQSTHANSTTTPAILHALTSTHPRARYPVAGGHGIPAWFVITLHSILPDHVVDSLYPLFTPPSTEDTRINLKQDL
eukprot:TRINITY_DN10704_c0_g1_i11.p1 TRINITY_DN10704_c0_g1~~TRINITY_DN10704_c0_g1_i11.p1  ORF type:complete len:345 (+),score=57.21 TRINITY_DN10704_c0_g1_i11:100-1134(+)